MADAFDGYNDWREQHGLDRMDDAFKHADDWGQKWNDHKNVHDLGQLGKPARQDNGRVSPGNDAGRSEWMPPQRSLFPRGAGASKGRTSGPSTVRTCADSCNCIACDLRCRPWFCSQQCAKDASSYNQKCRCPDSAIDLDDDDE